MTKKEMLYDIISNTNLCGLNENDVQNIINKTHKSEMEKIYNSFVNDKEHALFYYWLIANR